MSLTLLATEYFVYFTKGTKAQKGPISNLEVSIGTRSCGWHDVAFRGM